jgi:OFA family oxalate/formate antiporter-like MFS transporter
MLASGMAALSAVLAIFVLKPMREAHAQKYVNDNSAPPMGYRPVPDDLT